SCQPIVAGAPTIDRHLCGPCAEHFAAVQRYLTAFGVPFVITPRLVRGLDYYTRTVFEFVPEDARGTSTIGAGGRYDGLIEILGGKPTPGVGFATGIERIVLNMKKAGVEPPPLQAPVVYVAYADETQAGRAVDLCGQLRHAGVGTLVAAAGRSLKAQLRAAGRGPARFALILLGPNQANHKDMHGGAEETLDPADAIARLTRTNDLEGGQAVLHSSLKQ
ncbi:MAG: ATP phosphoribosyltransferase regulatory subunit, partial [Dehalococcoidia bacterium]